MGAVRIVRRGVFRQPVLHVQAGAGTFEDQISHTLVSLTAAGLSVLISVNVEACKRPSLAGPEQRRGGRVARSKRCNGRDRPPGAGGLYQEFAVDQRQPRWRPRPQP